MTFALGGDKLSLLKNAKIRTIGESGKAGGEVRPFEVDFDFRGRHVFADIISVPADEIHDRDFLLKTLRDGVRTSGATLLDEMVHDFTPSGFTALLLLAESHVSIHTYPEYGSLFLDAFTCGNNCDPDIIVDHFSKVVTCEVSYRRNHARGRREDSSLDSSLP